VSVNFYIREKSGISYREGWQNGYSVHTFFKRLRGRAYGLLAFEVQMESKSA
jgi:hypothetical protein